MCSGIQTDPILGPTRIFFSFLEGIFGILLLKLFFLQKDICQWKNEKSETFPILILKQTDPIFLGSCYLNATSSFLTLMNTCHTTASLCMLRAIKEQCYSIYNKVYLLPCKGMFHGFTLSENIKRFLPFCQDRIYSRSEEVAFLWRPTTVAVQWHEI